MNSFKNYNNIAAQADSKSITPVEEATLAASDMDILDETGGNGESQTAIETNHTELEAPSGANISTTLHAGTHDDEAQAQAQGVSGSSATDQGGEIPATTLPPRKRANPAEEKKRVLAEYQEKEGLPFLVLERTCNVPVNRVKNYMAEAWMDPNFPRHELAFDAEQFKNLPASLKQMLRAASGSDIAPDALVKLEPNERAITLSIYEI